MKLATLNNGRRDGELLVVSRDLQRAVSARDIAPTLQAAIDDWHVLAPRLEERFTALQEGALPEAFALSMSQLMAPLPRAFGWTDGSVYLHHMELARRLRGAEMPEGYRDDPRYYDGVSHTFRATGSPLPCPAGDVGLDFEGEIGVILDDVPTAVSEADAASKVLLLCLINDTTLRTVFAEQMRRGYTNFHGKPPCSMAPVVVTPDEAGVHWDGKCLSMTMECVLNGQVIGRPNTGKDMAFYFPEIIARATAHRGFGAGSVLAAGTVSNRDRSTGSACLAEVRMYEQLDFGEPRTPYLKPGDALRLDVVDANGASMFGAIEHQIVPQ
jgi:fumarylacetoacetate (FAA) hydrolase